MRRKNLVANFLLTLLMIGLPGMLSGQEVGDVLLGEKDDDAVEQTITLNSDASTDAAIANRLQQIYQGTNGLEAITVEVNAGVVTIQGEVLSQAEEAQAERLAKQVEGVVGVENNLSRIRNIKIRILHVTDRLVDRIYQLLANLPLLLLALFVILVFWMMARVLIRWDKVYQKISPNIFIADLLKQLTRGVLLVIGLIIALQIVDAVALLGSLMGAIGLIGLAIGFAIRDTVENYIASILLSIRQPFAPNDHIIIDNCEGKVVRLTTRATVLMTFEGNHIRVPNAIVYKGVMTNFTRNPERRFQFEVGVDTAVNLTDARALAIKTLLQTPGVLSTPPPSCQVETLGDSNVVLLVMGWTDQRHYDFLKVRSAGIQAVKEAFDAADFEMPEPIYRLKIQSDGFSVTESDASSTQPAKRFTPLLSEIHQQEAVSVSKDTDLDQKIATEAATEADLLNETMPRE